MNKAHVHVSMLQQSKQMLALAQSGVHKVHKIQVSNQDCTQTPQSTPSTTNQQTLTDRQALLRSELELSQQTLDSEEKEIEQLEICS